MEEGQWLLLEEEENGVHEFDVLGDIIQLRAVRPEIGYTLLVLARSWRI